LVLTGGNTPYRLYTPTAATTIKKEYGVYVGGFVKNDQLILAFQKDDNIVFYDVQNNFKPTKTVKIGEKIKGLRLNKVVSLPATDDGYCVLANREGFPVNPVEFIGTVLSGGHGIYYQRPYIAGIEDDKIMQYRKMNYGGNRDESYYIEDVISGAKTIHLLGFRKRPQLDYKPKPVNLYYTGYDVDKRKAVQTHSIMERESGGLNEYGPLSMANKKDDIFIAFSWNIKPLGGFQDNIKQFKSDIYYFQYCNNVASKTIQIAKGFLPLIKLDSAGNVYVFYVDYEGNLVCKTKQGDTWSKDRIILSGIDISGGIIGIKYIAAEFDSEDNLHLVYPSKGSLIYEKRKLSEVK
jgi:hypothetical protein